MPGGGAGTGGETCTLTFWLIPCAWDLALPQTLGRVGRRGSCNSEWARGVQDPAQLPSGRAGQARRGHAVATMVPNRSMCSVHTGGGGGREGYPLSWIGSKEQRREVQLALSCYPEELGLLLGASNDGEDVEEDVDDISVQAQCSEHVLLGAQRQLLIPQQQLGVHS